MTPNKKQFKFINNYLRYFLNLFIIPNFFLSYQLFAQENNKLNEIEINRTINYEDEDNLDLPTNPFEIVDRLRRANSLNNATKPSDAIDDAIKSFDMINEDK